MIKKILAFLIIVVAILAIIYFYQNNRNYTPPAENVLQPPIERTENANPEAVSDLERGGSSFSDPDSIFSILYPSEYVQDTQGENQYRIYKQGPTQKGQTEMYDGVIIHFQTVELRKQSLGEWVDAQISQSIADGTSELISPKKHIDINNYAGFTYTLRGLGEAVSYVIQKDINSPYAVSITTLVADPEEMGFEKEVNAILSTLQLLK